MISVTHLSKAFHDKKVLNDLSFCIEKGSITAVMAPSGVGKTTLLRILMGLEQADEGQVDGLEGLTLSAVFQEDRLCANLSPVSNIRLVTGKAFSKKEILEALNELGLGSCVSQPVRELSGGQRRRVCLLRALLAPWDLLLMDEPFKGLDAKTRDFAMHYVQNFCARRGGTVIFVTHDVYEAQQLADRVLTLPDSQCAP